MASLTVRQLDERIKQLLRLRAARNGRSVEDEVRTILRQAGEETSHEALDLINPPAPQSSRRLTAAPVAVAKRVLLIIGGGIAAYKSLDLIRRLRERGVEVRVVMTRAAQEFVTPLSVGAIAGERAHTDLFDAKTEFDIGHIRLARDTDLIIVAPATADLMAKIAGGHADDLASTVLLATTAPILIAPAMNPRMWEHSATRRNLVQLETDGIVVVGPNAGEMAESGEAGIGRMAEPLEIVAAAETLLAGSRELPLAGKRVLITSGPTHEPIDPVRFITNRSSGKQGHAIARAAAEAGAEVILVSGPVALPDPPGVDVVHVESARDMLTAVEAGLPADVAIFAAAVADWRPAEVGEQKLKKSEAGTPKLSFVENPDILATIARRKTERPGLVIGFAAETEHVVEHAEAKLKKKGCDWILANDVSAASGVMGGDLNSIQFVTADGIESWPTQSKDDVARMLVAHIAAALESAS